MCLLDKLSNIRQTSQFVCLLASLSLFSSFTALRGRKEFYSFLYTLFFPYWPVIALNSGNWMSYICYMIGFLPTILIVSLPFGGSFPFAALQGRDQGRWDLYTWKTILEALSPLDKVRYPISQDFSQNLLLSKFTFYDQTANSLIRKEQFPNIHI